MQKFFVEISAERALNRKEAYPLILEKAKLDAKARGVENFFVKDPYPNGGPFRKYHGWKAWVVEVILRGEVI